MDEAVNYQTISSRNLARSILSEGGWSNLLCTEKKLQQSADLALVFVGRELLSSDVSSSKNADPALVNLLKDYLVSKMEKRTDGQADLVVFCHGGLYSSKGLEQPQTESETLSELISSVDTLGAKYEVLYISDPFRSIQYPSHRELERFLAEGTAGNGSLNSTICDEVCKIKSSLLEGVLVGIVLLIILISGLCCMMGIDTPTKFETPQDS
ncbi:hypothetical protein GH714_027769 [Hevea brasiliensis]|uniref:V-type proton ATPase subunit S1/VOA1 transmembrane domain-containing protein n=1 Tax=Hevea brasiliensis TaxID=3981 RepID=A0A6A6MQY5_HEVBR|nr:hypothetical protein GH714_027769 [Hevea brasiliensis]